MNDDEDSIWSWLLSIALGVAIAATLIGWPILAWNILWSVFK